MFYRVLVACLAALALGTPAIPQQAAAPKADANQAAAKPGTPPAQQQQPATPQDTGTTIKVNSTEIIVPVSVTDDRGKFVSNLEARDFRILDEGRPQRIRFFSHDSKQPVVIGFLLDMSNSTRTHWKVYQDAIMEMVWALLPGDPRYTGYLITYSTQAELAVNTTQDSEKITDKIRSLRPGGAAALADAIYRACTDRKLVPGEPYEPRRVIIVVGDGHDTSSNHTMEQVLELAQRNLVTIYAISTQNFGFDNPDQDVLERLVRLTGGRIEYPLNNLYKDVDGYLSHPSDDGNYALTVGSGGYAAQISSGIIKAVGGIAGDITQQYVMRYIPDVTDTKEKQWRRIAVDIPELPNVKIRAKPGYWAMPPVQR
jgi:Ca-activated chloride channel family protein